MVTTPSKRNELYREGNATFRPKDKPILVNSFLDKIKTALFWGRFALVAGTPDCWKLKLVLSYNDRI